MANRFREKAKKEVDNILESGKLESQVSPDINENNDENENTNMDTDTNVNVNVNVNKIVIHRKQEDKGEELQRATFYFKKKHLKSIDKYYKQSGMGKSEFLNDLLDQAFAALEIK